MGRRPSAWLRDNEVDRNVYYSAVNPGHAEESLKVSQGGGVDAHSIAADPLFVNVERHDFRLRPESSALKLGFQLVDRLEMGPTRASDSTAPATPSRLTASGAGPAARGSV